jgi:hypothetical protein
MGHRKDLVSKIFKVDGEWGIKLGLIIWTLGEDFEYMRKYMD